MRSSDWSSDVCSSVLECPPASAFGRRLLLYFAPKDTHPHLPTCAAVEGRKTEIRLSKNPAFRQACDPTSRRGRQAFGANVPRHPPSAHASSFISPRRPAARAGTHQVDEKHVNRRQVRLMRTDATTPARAAATRIIRIQIRR